MQGPNIFKYAPKEFSQDAFICYLVACAAKASGELKQCGLAFVRTLFRAGSSDEILGPDGKRADSSPYDGPCNASDVINIRCQYNINSNDRLDVYFQAKIDERLVTFIIENKIDGEADVNQLKRYLKAVIEDEEEQDLIKPIFFKTGYVFSDKRMDVERAKYSVFEAKDMKSFLDGQAVTRENEILRQYAEYLAAFMEPRIKAQQEWDLDEAHVQWKFMLKLRDRLGDAVGEWQSFMSGFPEWTWGGLGRGKNKGGGGLWTQYWFTRHLFWRLDSWKLRLMIDREQAGNVEGSDSMLYKYRNCFDRALQEEGLSDGGARRVKGNQCTVGSVEIPNFQEMTASDFLDRVTRVHIGFLEFASVARYPLLTELWCEIESALQEDISDLPLKSEDVSEEKIKRFSDHGLYYPFGSGAASLGVRLEEGSIFSGVYCKKHEQCELYMALKKALRDVSSEEPNCWWPWWTWANGDLEPLQDEGARRKYAKGISQSLKPVWDAIKRADLD